MSLAEKRSLSIACENITYAVRFLASISDETGQLMPMLVSPTTKGGSSLWPLASRPEIVTAPCLPSRSMLVAKDTVRVLVAPGQSEF